MEAQKLWFIFYLAFIFILHFKQLSIVSLLFNILNHTEEKGPLRPPPLSVINFLRNEVTLLDLSINNKT